MLADTKLSPHSGESWRWADQANKIVCLNDDWAIAFAGNTHFADEALKHLPPDSRFDDLKRVLLEAHLKSRSYTSNREWLVQKTRKWHGVDSLSPNQKRVLRRASCGSKIWTQQACLQILCRNHFVLSAPLLAL